MTEKLTTTISENAKEVAAHVADDARQVANDLRGPVRQVKSELEDVAGIFERAIHDSAVRQPVATLAIAVCVGFALGAIWKA